VPPLGLAIVAVLPLPVPPLPLHAPAQTDEDEMGVSYDFVELFTGLYLPLSDAEKVAWTAALSPEAAAQFEALAAKVQAIHKRNSHKSPPGPKNL
jgi:hypothetical protein